MNIRPTISIPLPWLTMIAGRFLGKKGGKKGRSVFRNFPRSLSVTREGKFFIGILLVIGVAAINTGNNLLYLVVATLLSLIIISGIMSESTLRGLKATRSFPPHIYRGSPANVTLTAANPKKYLPSFSFFLKETETERLNAEAAYFLKLGAGGKSSRTARYTFNTRGVVKLESVEITTRFPFGLFLKGKKDIVGDEALVYPSVKAIKKNIAAETARTAGETRVPRRGEGAGLYALREYGLSDDARHIHWRSAAKASRLLIKEFEKDAEKSVIITFDNYQADDEKAFEDAVDEAASLANYYIGRNWSVGLKTLSGKIPPKTGKSQLHAILRALALITPSKAQGKPSVRVDGL